MRNMTGPGESIFHRPDGALDGTALRELLLGNSLHIGDRAVSYYATISDRITRTGGRTYVSRWSTTDEGLLHVESIRRGLSARYWVVLGNGMDANLPPPSVTIYRHEDGGAELVLQHARGNPFELGPEGAEEVAYE